MNELQEHQNFSPLKAPFDMFEGSSSLQRKMGQSHVEAVAGPLRSPQPSQKEETVPGEASENCAKISALTWVWFYDVFFLHGKNWVSLFLMLSLGSKTIIPKFSKEFDALFFCLSSVVTKPGS